MRLNKRMIMKRCICHLLNTSVTWPSEEQEKPSPVTLSSQDINLSNFYGTFQLVLRDSKTLEVQTSTSKSCLFRTQDMMGELVS